MPDVFIMDIGSQSLTVLAISKNLIWEHSWVTSLARGGVMDPGGVEALKQAVLEAVRRSPVKKRPVAVGTGIFRKDEDEGLLKFLHEISDFRIISGQEEALLTSKGVAFRLNIMDPFAVVDPGGATTEMGIVARPEVLKKKKVLHGEGGIDCSASGQPMEDSVDDASMLRLSRPVGAFTAGTPARALDEGIAMARSFRKDMELWGVGGTMTTLAALDLGLERYDATVVNGHELTVSRIEELRDYILSSSESHLARNPLIGKRARALPVAASIALGLTVGWGRGYIRVADAGVRWGVASELLNWSMP